MAKAKRKVEIIDTGKVRLLFPHLLEPHKYKSTDKKAVYDTMVMVPKSDTQTVKKLQLACKKAELAVFPDGRPDPDDFHYPLKKGEVYAKKQKVDPEKYKDYIIFKAKSDERWPPTLVGPNPRKAITAADAKHIYSGCAARVGVTCKAYADSPGDGVAFYLSMVQILSGGAPLITGPDPAEFFEEEADFGSGDDLDGGLDDLDSDLGDDLNDDSLGDDGDDLEF